MDLGLADKKVFVTGGSSGIGRAIARTFAAEGAEVAFTYFSAPEAGQSLVKLRAALFVAMVVMTVSTANAASRVYAFMHGNDLFQNCQNRDSSCLSYVTGVADTLEMVAPHLTNICRPSGVTIEQLSDVLIAWLEEHPAERHRPAAKLAGMAFAEAWPCHE